MDDLITIHEKLKALIAGNNHKNEPNKSPDTYHNNEILTVSTTKPLYTEKRGKNTYEIWSAASKQDAFNYLKSRKVTERLYYVVVETPDGNFGKDIHGYYEENAHKNMQSNIKDTEVTSPNSVNISDENNIKKYQKLIQEADLIQATVSSSYLQISDHDQKTIDAFSRANSGQRCDLVNCQQNQNLCVTLHLYRIFIEQNDDEETKSDIAMHDIFNDNYGITSLVDDFHHLLFNHEHQFEDIHNQLQLQFQLLQESVHQETCPLAKCTIVRRHYSKKLEQLSANTNDNIMPEIVQRQILDKIHCYYLHSFDIGYRFRARDILEDEQKSDQNVFINHSNAGKNIAFDRIKSGKDRFITDIHELVYDHGIRFFYWAYYKDKIEMDDVSWRRGDELHVDKGLRVANKGYSVKECYIEKKYSNLKDEFLNNPICALSSVGFASLRQQAGIHLKSIYVKSMKSVGKDPYEIEHDAAVTAQHLIAMIAYCNQDELQAKFSETFRRRENESFYSMKMRHRNYTNFGRLLRELIECFGQTGVGDKEVGSIQLFHGVSAQTQFMSVMARMKGPVSATHSYAIAVKFAGNGGLILQFTLSNKWIIPQKGDEYGFVSYHSHDNRCAFLDCHWLSAYPAEQERFFIGGYGYFYFENIITAPSGNNYLHYIEAMRLISETLQASQKYLVRSQFGKITTQIAFRLLSHELHKHFPNDKNHYPFKSIPPYIDRLFHNFCKNAGALSFYHFSTTYDDESKFDFAKMKSIFQSIFFYDNDLMKWQILAKLFPSLTQIWIEQNCNGDGICDTNSQINHNPNLEMIQKAEFWTLLSTFLEQRNKPVIVISLNNVPPKQCEIIFEQKESAYGDLFRNIAWNILLKKEPIYSLEFTPYGYGSSMHFSNAEKSQKFVDEWNKKKIANLW
eukprot:93400_1